MKTWLVSGIFFSFLFVALSPSAHAFQRSIGSEKNVVLYWKKLPATFYIHSGGTPDIQNLQLVIQTIRAGFTTWTQPSCGCFQFNYLGTTPNRAIGYNRDNPELDQNVISFQTSNWQHNQQAVAVTSTIYNLDTGEIIAFDMEFNNINFRFSLDGKARDGIDPRGRPIRIPTIDLQNTTTHEAGHALGLDHSPIESTTMFALAPHGETSKRTLHQDDISGLCTIYKNESGSCRIETNGQDKIGGCGCNTTNPSALPQRLEIWLLFLFFVGFLTIRRSS